MCQLLMTMEERASLCLPAVVRLLPKGISPPGAPYSFLVHEHSLPEAILMTSLFLSPQVPLACIYFFLCIKL